MAKIAILGFGIVGSGTAELFYKNKESIEKRAGQPLDIKYILDIREFPLSPFKDKIIHDVDMILNDEEITVVAELMGGVEPAFTFVRECLKAGKSVVTSNKELVAQKGAELLKIAKENGRNFLFEASVGGGIPIIRPIHKCLAANDITEITGILNGTTNFILTKMFYDGMSFKDALELAQKLGYAERNPAADVDGIDTCRKICILASLAFGKHVYPENVTTKGISAVTAQDVENAEKAGCKIKLIARAVRQADSKILPFVSPMLVPNDNMLSNVNDVFNGIMVYGDGIEKVMFYGRGAGKLPTASAVVSDIIEAAKHERTVFSQDWEDSSDASFIEKYSVLECEMYVRIKGADQSSIEQLFGDPAFICSDVKGEICFITAKAKVSDTDEKLEVLKNSGVEVLSEIPVLEENV